VALSPEVQRIADSFQNGSDYRVNRKQQEVLFSRRAMPRLKWAVGWDEVPSLKAVSMAERVEDLVARREGVGRAGGRETLAEISVQGYLGGYKVLMGFSSGGKPGRTIDDILAESRKSEPPLRELTFEREFDRQRSKIYGCRARVRDEPATLSFLDPIVTNIVQTWLASGEDALMTGLRDVLAEQQAPQQIDEALSGASSQHDLSYRAARSIENAIDGRKDELGESQMATLLRQVLLGVVDVEWREHIKRVRFLQRQSGALYYQAADLDEARNADVRALFSACEQMMRAESIKYLLNADPD
jgi:preprotein translocase subunit SecA